MFVFLASVHHTGTQFTQKLFEDCGYELTDKTPDEAGGSALSHISIHKNYLHRCHISPEVSVELAMWLDFTSVAEHSVDAVPLVVPLRHPVAVANSWLLRGKPISLMYQQFCMLIDDVAGRGPRETPYQPVFLPIDHPEREGYLDNVCRAVGHKLPTHWPLIASKKEGYYPKKRRMEMTPDEQELLTRLADEPLLTEFYPEPWPI